jgi:aryl-alcohol dehydrogenase-like predicted oxidoreductase
VHPIADLQIEYSLISRGIEKTILPTCRAVGIGLTAYGVLSRGLISGHWQAQKQTGAKDFRASIPRFQGANLDQNLAIADEIKRVADARGATVAQVAIAWVLSRGNDIAPLVGARRRDRLSESLGALSLTLDGEALSALENIANSVRGERYAKAQMSHLDSERS